jgi:hypothetical protein
MHRLRNKSAVVMVTFKVGNSVSEVTDYRLDERGSIPGECRDTFLLATASRPTLRSKEAPMP